MKKTILFVLLLCFVQCTISAQTAEQMVSDKAVAFDERSELASLLEYVNGERLVLMGEASHGTSEFYTKRAFMSKTSGFRRGVSFYCS
jgi:erythromycin esterase-like protein